ncbi:MAG: conserved protein associated with acetyl-CoA C-acyltransferase [Candidatus Ozemobacter sibiricus]|jgi:uncharacterized OB-fold protein|uniref:Conserved protein associated with acetyl-CoA C-acyltransferase n=1 Tax=Candidatus Ozemobacter sibiricus TaxID=2268124 RepID=A0A367ZP44_9BACT|nr:MAG: conserved protein associated with acetyl-CoA C-acyltransferase [Candidatus Ozemobacter sibiricus]
MERHILGYKCRGCGHVWYPNRAVCQDCRGTEFEPVPLPKTGKLLTFTVLHNLAVDFEVPSLTLGIVELSNGNRITGHLKIDQPKIGMKVTGKVEPVRQVGYHTSYGMVFYKG